METSFAMCHEPCTLGSPPPYLDLQGGPVKRCDVEIFSRRVSSNLHLGFEVFAGPRELLLAPKHHGLQTTISTSLSFVVRLAL
jgi:hypothetical protein